MKKTKFNWECVHCGKRNIIEVAFQFDAPKQYHTHWECAKCGKKTKIWLNFITDLPDAGE